MGHRFNRRNGDRTFGTGMDSVQKVSTGNGALFQLFRTFFRIGAFTFGGGYAMIPLIQREVVERHRWVSEADILDVVAIAESTPGPIAINAATFIGCRVAGPLGALCATLGVVMPSFLIILAVSFALEAFQSLRVVRYAFWGIRAGVLSLILKALVSLYRKCEKDWFAWGVMAAAFLAVAFFHVGAIAVILVSAALGLAFHSMRRARP